MIFSFGNQEAYGNPLEPCNGIHATSLLIEAGTLLIVTIFVFFSFLFFPGASITLKAIPGIETACLQNNKVPRQKAMQQKQELRRQNTSVFI